ncbi:hypothetical protein DPEC_G00320760 [Dallia pectoralis]|uniref:Uncharacterized protein n=1 Tax=Dallia pectoralis TaxID=75939 RepID=A0ACC2F9R3_DALPE|nr:hypothetical protein DPEC_G00320760 [Dallia pectoralis]
MYSCGDVLLDVLRYLKLRGVERFRVGIKTRETGSEEEGCEVEHTRRDGDVGFWKGEGGEAEVSPRCRYIGSLIPSFIDFEEHHQVAYSGDNTHDCKFGEKCLAKKRSAHSSERARIPTKHNGFMGVWNRN